MVSTTRQHEHCVCASHAAWSELTRAVAALPCAVKQAALDLLQQPFHASTGQLCIGMTGECIEASASRMLFSDAVLTVLLMRARACH